MTQALWALGGAFGSIAGGFLGAKFGRRNTLLMNNSFILSGIILQVRHMIIQKMLHRNLFCFYLNIGRGQIFLSLFLSKITMFLITAFFLDGF